MASGSSGQSNRQDADRTNHAWDRAASTANVPIAGQGKAANLKRDRSMESDGHDLGGLPRTCHGLVGL